jgi:hypothetical protein
LRVLIAMEENYRIYRAMIASGLHAMRPHLQVVTAGPAEFVGRLESFNPQIVICGGRSFARSGGAFVWMDLAFDSAVPLHRPARIWVGDRCREVPNPDLNYLLLVIDEVDPSYGLPSPGKGRLAAQTGGNELPPR